MLIFYCVTNTYFGELPWLAAMCGFPWSAYGVSQACYYRKAEKENTKGIIQNSTTFKVVLYICTPLAIYQLFNSAGKFNITNLCSKIEEYSLNQKNILVV